MPLSDTRDSSRKQDVTVSDCSPRLKRDPQPEVFEAMTDRYATLRNEPRLIGLRVIPLKGLRESASPGRLNEPGIRPEPVREVPMLLWEQDPDVLRIPRETPGK